jgi:membrane-associated phospholipid phosphatase
MTITDTAFFRHTLVLMALACAGSAAMGLILGFSIGLDSVIVVAGLFAVLTLAAWHFGSRRKILLGGAILQSMAFYFAVPSVLVVMSYVFAGAGFPLADARLALVDRSIGFDWTAHLAFVWSVPHLGRALEFAYHATAVTLLVTFGVLLAMRSYGRLAEMWYLMVACGVATMLVATLLPAEGAFLFHKPAADLAVGAAADNGIWHLKDFRAIRSGELRFLDLGRMEGIVTFPSYHTAMAMIFAWALRGTLFFIPSALFSAVVILSTLAIGGHYLIDVIAGAAMTAAIMALATRKPLPDTAGTAQPAAV